jgi:hypothetical protein
MTHSKTKYWPVVLVKDFIPRRALIVSKVGVDLGDVVGTVIVYKFGFRAMRDER